MGSDVVRRRGHDLTPRPWGEEVRRTTKPGGAGLGVKALFRAIAELFIAGAADVNAGGYPAPAAAHSMGMVGHEDMRDLLIAKGPVACGRHCSLR